MKWIEQNFVQITLVIAAIIIIAVGRGPMLPHVKRSKVLLWAAFVVTAACGLVLGWALSDVTSWITSRGGAFGGAVASLGAIIAVAAGWWSVDMLVALIRDLADCVPDGDARRAALWVPTTAPAGMSAAWGIMSNPGGVGTGITALIIAAITVGFCVKISKSALAGQKLPRFWHYFAAAACLLGGIVLIPLVAWLDTKAADLLSGNWLTGARIVAGSVGLALLAAMLVDWFKDKIPDQHVRNFALVGVPLLVVCGAVVVAHLTDAANSSGAILLGGLK